MTKLILCLVAGAVVVRLIEKVTFAFPSGALS